MIMQSTESFTEEKEKYTPWGWEVSASEKAEKDTLCRKFPWLLPTHKSPSPAGALRGWRWGATRDPAPLGKRAGGAPAPPPRRGSPARADHTVCHCSTVSLTPHPASSPHQVAPSPRDADRQSPPSGGHPSAAEPGDPRAPRGPPARPPPGPPALQPRGPQAPSRPPSDAAAGSPPPHLSAGLPKPPDLLRGSRLRKPAPGHAPPARWRRLRRRRLRSERAPPCTGQRGRRARRLARRGGGAGASAGSPNSSLRAARAGLPGSGGQEPGAESRRAPPSRAPPQPGARSPGPAANTRAAGGGPRRVRAQPARSAAGDGPYQPARGARGRRAEQRPLSAAHPPAHTSVPPPHGERRRSRPLVRGR